MSADVSTLASKTLRQYTRYLDDTENDWIDYEQAPHLEIKEWAEREDPCDPDVDE